MSMLTPGLPATQAIRRMGYNFPAWANVTPFTYQDGNTFAKMLESLIAYVDTDLVPYLDAQTTLIVDAWKETVQQIIDDVQNNSIDLQDPVLAALLTNTTSQSYAALNAFVSALIADPEKDGTFTLRGDSANPFKIIGAKSTGELPAFVKDYLDGLYAGKSAGYTKQQADDRFEPFDSAYTKQESNDRYALKNDAATKTEVAEFGNLVRRGTFAARPAANTVAEKTQYVCTDIPEQYMAVAGTWLVYGSGGNELGSVEWTGPLVNTAAGASVGVEGFSTTFKVGQRPIVIDVSCRIAASVSGAVVYAELFVDDVRVGFMEAGAKNGANRWSTENYTKRMSGLVPGSLHTARIAVRVGDGGGNVLLSGDQSPCTLIVRTS